MRKMDARYLIAVFLFSSFINLFSTTTDATSILRQSFKLDILDKGVSLEGGTPDALAFPKTIGVMHYYCPKATIPTYDELKRKSATILLDISLDGTLTKVQMIEPEFDSTLEQMLDALVACSSLERAFAERGIYGWENIKVRINNR